MKIERNIAGMNEINQKSVLVKYSEFQKKHCIHKHKSMHKNPMQNHNLSFLQFLSGEYESCAASIDPPSCVEH